MTFRLLYLSIVVIITTACSTDVAKRDGYAYQSSAEGTCERRISNAIPLILKTYTTETYQQTKTNICYGATIGKLNINRLLNNSNNNSDIDVRNTNRSAIAIIQNKIIIDDGQKNEREDLKAEKDYNACLANNNVEAAQAPYAFQQYANAVKALANVDISSCDTNIVNLTIEYKLKLSDFTKLLAINYNNKYTIDTNKILKLQYASNNTDQILINKNRDLKKAWENIVITGLRNAESKGGAEPWTAYAQQYVLQKIWNNPVAVE